MPRVTFVNERYAIDVPAGTNLRRAMMDTSVQVYRGFGRIINCRGNGMCGQCKVAVEPDAHVTPRTVRERAKLFLGDKRLACQIDVQDDIRVTTYHPRPIDPQGVAISSDVPAPVIPPKPPSEL